MPISRARNNVHQIEFRVEGRRKEEEKDMMKSGGPIERYVKVDVITKTIFFNLL